MIIGSLNLMHAGREDFAFCSRSPSAAQARILTQLYDAVHGFISDAPMWPSGAEIRDCLRLTSGYVPEGGAAVPLGDGAGVPGTAATIPVSQLLHDTQPHVAGQCRRPAALLLPLARRPKKLVKCYTRLSRSYPTLVDKACAGGLQRLVRGNRVWKHNGKRMVGGAFAVKKDEHKDRMISDLPVNQLVDQSKVLRPRFGYPPRLRALVATPGRMLVVRKRDLRHYFHQLLLGA